MQGVKAQDEEVISRLNTLKVVLLRNFTKGIYAIFYFIIENDRFYSYRIFKMAYGLYLVVQQIMLNQVAIYKRLEDIERSSKGGFRSAPGKTYVQELAAEAEKI